MDDGIKLKLINFNKKLQTIIDINIINYRRYAKSFIIYEDNKIGKEYNSYNDNLIFKEEYLNRKRNGKEKEYDNKSTLIFEGEYLNGKGKEYDEYGQLKYNAEYINGQRYELNNIYEYLNTQRDGKIKEYEQFFYLIFEGEYLNGLKNGKEFIESNLIFDGEYLNGKK